jgi:hypothetical protein
MRYAWVVLYVVVGVPQFVAIRAGLEHWFSMGLLPVGLGALPLAYVPILGAATSALAAMDVWGWSGLGAASLYLFTAALPFLAIALAGAGSSEDGESTERGGSSERAVPAAGAAAMIRPLPDRAVPEPETASILAQAGASPLDSFSVAVNGAGSASDADYGLFERAFKEIETQQLAKGIWARALSESGGDEHRARALYISLRVDHLQKELATHARREAEQEKISEAIPDLSADPATSFRLAVEYLTGESRPRDPFIAFELFRGASQGGLSAAQYNVGLMYERGEGVSTDASAALHWYRQAAAQGHFRAMLRLARAFQLGQLGLPISPQEESAWRAKAVATKRHSSTREPEQAIGQPVT